MKNIFEVSKEEKERIINLHESATKNLYIKEAGEGVEPWMQGDNPSGNPKKSLNLNVNKNEDTKKIKVVYPSNGSVEGLGYIEISSKPLTGLYLEGRMFIEIGGARQVLVPNITDLTDGKIKYSQIKELCQFGICGEKVWVPSYEELGGLRPKWVACQVNERTSTLVPEMNTQNVLGKVIG